nr:hypothetical protein [uncultured Carboxylicivirga sp.]
MQKSYFKEYLYTLLSPNKIVMCFFIVYLLFPTQNSSGDSWGYATDIKFQINLFRPHHLLYNSFGLIIYKILKIIFGNIDVLAMMKMLNAFFAALLLIITNKILKLLNKNTEQRFAWLFFIGSSFGVFRYATDNETYIIPIFFSLLASFFYINFHNHNRKIHLFYSGAFASIACLFHQIMFFWWLGILIGLLASTNRKYFFYYILPSLIVPIVYWVIFTSVHNDHSIIHLLGYIFHDYLSGSAKTNIGWQSFLLTPINIFRTFIQIHGNILLIIKNTSVLLIFLLLILIPITYLFKANWKITINHNFNNNIFLTHLTIFILHLCFAFFSSGNAEFMVMMPFLIAIITLEIIKFPSTNIRLIASIMFLWNFGLSILPSSLYNFYDTSKLIETIKLNPNSIFILQDNLTTASEYEYIYGEEINMRIISFESYHVNKTEFDSIYTNIYTDIFDRPTPLNRAKLTIQSANISEFHKDKVLITLNGLLGEYGIYSIAKSSN